MNPIKNHRTVARLVLGVAVVGNLLSMQLTSQAANYTYTDLNPTNLQPSGFVESFGNGISGGHQVGYWHANATEGNKHALLWAGAASSAVDLHPSGYTASTAAGLSGNQQVGAGSGFQGSYSSHALLWSGTASNVVDLNPDGFAGSFGAGVSGGQQVGYGAGPATGYYSHALLWSGTAASVVDLHPSGFDYSWGYGISGTQQVGSAFSFATGGAEHALLWSGTAASVVDLHPDGFVISGANAVSGGQQAGFGFPIGSPEHALLWFGTAGSVVDLNPTGSIESAAYGNSTGLQAGFCVISNSEGFYLTHAFVWSGTAASAVDLGAVLPPDYGESYANSVGENGNVIGYAYHFHTLSYHAILWTLVHESVVRCNDPGRCGAVVTYTNGTGVTCNPPSGSFFPVGTNVVTCTSSNPPTNYTFNVIVKDCEAPIVSCSPVHKLSGKGNGQSDKDSEREKNPDGLFQLSGHDNCDSNPRLYLQDSVSGFVAGPFANGDVVKITKKQGRQESDDAKDSKNSAVVAHINLQGNGLLYGVDASGNVGTAVLCSASHREDH